MGKTRRIPEKPEITYLMKYLDLLKKGDYEQATKYKEEVLPKVSKRTRSELELAIEGANSLEIVARELRPFIRPEAADRTLRAIRRRIKK